MARRTTLRLEQLEDRQTPALFGVAWPDPHQLTLSFAPNGTGPTALTSDFSSLDAAVPDWQLEVLRAFQTWASVADIDIHVVADDGSPEGIAGPTQSDPRFGDIRLFASPLASSSLAVALPFDPSAGTWAGDIRLNSTLNFGPDGLDLYSVLLHESAHSLGLNHSTDIASARFPTYNGPRTGLTVEDVAAIQAMYGARVADEFDTARSNDTQADATDLGPAARWPVSGDLTTSSDVDWYTFRATSTDELTITLATSDVSLVQGRFAVYNADGVLLGEVEADRPGEDLSVRLTGLKQGDRLYVRAAGTGDFAVGGYRLELSTEPPRAPENVPERGANDTPIKAESLMSTLFRSDPRFEYLIRSEIASPDDVDWYRFRSPRTDGLLVLNALAWATEPGGMSPRLTVTDIRGHVLDAVPLVRDDGSTVLQLIGVEPNANYLVRVESTAGSGMYVLGLDFGTVPADRTVFALRESLGGGASHELTLERSQLYAFSLRNDSTVGDLTLEVLDADGIVLHTATAVAGDARSLAVFMAPGTYTLRVSGAGATYSLWGTGLTDPIGPHALNPVSVPAGGPIGPPAGGSSQSGNTPTPTIPPATTPSSSTSTPTTATPTLPTGPEAGFAAFVVGRPVLASSPSSSSPASSAEVVVGQPGSTPGTRLVSSRLANGTVFQIIPTMAVTASSPTVAVSAGVGSAALPAVRVGGVLGVSSVSAGSSGWSGELSAGDLLPDPVGALPGWTPAIGTPPPLERGDGLDPIITLASATSIPQPVVLPALPALPTATPPLSEPATASLVPQLGGTDGTLGIIVSAVMLVVAAVRRYRGKKITPRK